MEFLIRDALIKEGWEPSHFSWDQRRCFLNLKDGNAVLLPFGRIRRLIYRNACVKVKDLIFKSGVKLKFCSTLKHDRVFHGFVEPFGHIDKFSFDTFLDVTIPPYHPSMMDFYFGLLDEEITWQISHAVLTNILEVYVFYPENYDISGKLTQAVRK